MMAENEDGSNLQTTGENTNVPESNEFQKEEHVPEENIPVHLGENLKDLPQMPHFFPVTDEVNVGGNDISDYQNQGARPKIKNPEIPGGREESDRNGVLKDTSKKTDSIRLSKRAEVIPPTAESPIQDDSLLTKQIALMKGEGTKKSVEEKHVERQNLKQEQKKKDDINEDNINIHKEETILIRGKNKEETDRILKLICACLNSTDKAIKTLTLVNKQYEKAVTKDFESWTEKLVKKIQKKFDLVENIEFEGNCNAQLIRLHVVPAAHLCTVDYYLYYATVSSVEKVDYRRAIEILTNRGPPHCLNHPENKEYFMFQTVAGIRNENVDVQLKAITGDNVPNTLVKMSSHYISAFANNMHKPMGRVYFGIDDDYGKVVGVSVSDVEHEIETAIAQKMKRMILGNGIVMERYKHWDVTFYDITVDLVDLREPLVVSTKEFKGPMENSLIFKANDFLQKVEDKKIDGREWWICRNRDGKEGIVPSSYLKQNEQGYTAKRAFDGKLPKPLPIEKGEVLMVLDDEHVDELILHCKNIHGKTGQVPRSCVHRLQDEKRKIIVLSVARIPGGVFTAKPRSFYADIDGNVLEYSFEEWKREMEQRHKDSPATKKDVGDLKKDIEDLFDNKTRNKMFVGNVIGRTVPFPAKGPCNVKRHHTSSSFIETETYRKVLKAIENNNCVTLKGYTGTGKSECALNFGCKISESDERCIVWQFDCNTYQLLLESFSSLCKHLQQKIDNTEMKEEDHILTMGEIVIEYLKNHHVPCNVLIMENVSNETLQTIKTFVKTYCSKAQNVKVLITSSRHVEGYPIDVLGFTEEEALNFLKQHHKRQTEGEQDDKYKKLASSLSWNPLGLQIAITYINECKLTIGTFLEKLTSEKGPLCIENNAAIKESPGLKPLFHTLHSVFVDLNEKHPRVFAKLLLLQFLHTENIPVVLLEKVQFWPFFSKESTDTDCDSVDALVFTLENYSFGKVYGADHERTLNVHDAIILALRSFTLERYERKAVVEMIESLIWSVICLMDKDNRMFCDLEKHNLILPHAASILVNVEKFEEGFEISMMDQMSVALSLMHVADLVGYTYNFEEMDQLGNRYYDMAKSVLFQMLKEKKFDSKIMEFCKSCTDIKMLENEAWKKTEYLFDKLKSIEKSHDKELIKFGKFFVLHKSRSCEEMKKLQTLLGQKWPQMKQLLTNADYTELVSRAFAIPAEVFGKVYFYEVVISFLYSYGRRLFYLPEKCEPTRARYFCFYLYVARHLSTFISERYNQWILFYKLVAERSGTIQQALSDKSNLGQLTVDNLQCLADRCVETLLKDNQNYFRFGVLYLNGKDDEHN